MDFSIAPEHEAIRDTVRRFVERELIPLERDVIRREGAMAKIQCTEMVTRVIDRAIQMHGGMGLSKVEYMARAARVWRIVEGPSEVHRWLVARGLLRHAV